MKALKWVSIWHFPFLPAGTMSSQNIGMVSISSCQNQGRTEHSTPRVRWCKGSKKENFHQLSVRRRLGSNCWSGSVVGSVCGFQFRRFSFSLNFKCPSGSSPVGNFVPRSYQDLTPSSSIRTVRFKHCKQYDTDRVSFRRKLKKNNITYSVKSPHLSSQIEQ